MHTHTEHILVWLAFKLVLLKDIDAAIDVIAGRWIHTHNKHVSDKLLIDKTSVVECLSVLLYKFNACLSIDFISIACNGH